MRISVTHPQSGSSSTVTALNLNLERLGFVKAGKLEYLEKNLWSKEEYQQQTQPVYGVNSGNQTWATLVGGECSCHCTIPALKGMR